METLKEVQLTEEQFDELFHLKKNHFFENPEDCSFNGQMFETYGQEHDYIRKLTENPETRRTIWTIIESDTNDNLYYLSGYHWVNRLGFLVTEEQVEEGIEYEVEIVIEMDK